MVFLDKNNTNKTLLNYIQKTLIIHPAINILDLKYLLHLIYTLSINKCEKNLTLQ